MAIQATKSKSVGATSRMPVAIGMWDRLWITAKSLAQKTVSFFSKAYVIPPSLLFALTRLPARVFFMFFAGLKVEGAENLKSLPRGAIFAANHTTEADPIIMTLLFKPLSRHLPLFFVSREKTYYGWHGWRKLLYGGAFFKMWGAYPAYAGTKDYEVSLRNHIGLLNDGCSVCIFPEGKRNFDGVVREARGGVAYLAHRTGCPVVPVALSGVTGLTLKNLLLRRHRIVIKIGKPLLHDDIFGKENLIGHKFKDNMFRAGAAVVMSKVVEMMGMPKDTFAS